MKKHKLLRLLTAALAAVTVSAGAAFTALADEGDTVFPGDSQPDDEIITCGDYTYSMLINAEDSSQKAACIESYTGSDEEIEIPSKLDGLDVVMLGDNAFADYTAARKITIPKTVTELGKYTFAACTGVEEYAVEAGSMEFAAENGILYNSDGTSLLRYPLGTNPTEVVIPDGITAIGNVAFADSSTLSAVQFPESLTTIGVSSFSDCPELRSVVIPDGVKLISSFAFNSCKNLKQVTLPANLVEIGPAAFAATAIEFIVLPGSLTDIGEQAFAATPMKSVMIPRNVSEIGYSAFGWNVDIRGEVYPVEGFTISGYSSTAAENYVYDSENNGKFVFEPIIEDEVPAEEEADDSGERTGKSGVLRVIGISACAVLILGILGAAAFSGKKKPKKQTKETASPETDAEKEPETETESDQGTNTASEEASEHDA